jgi:CRISPR-associated protein Cas4
MLSVSALTSYLYCQRKLYLQRVLGFYEPPKEATVKGKIRHKIYEQINNKEEEIVSSITEKISLEEILQLYKKHYNEILRDVIRKSKEDLNKFEIKPNEFFKQLWPLILNESETRANNIHNFMEFHLVFGKKLWEKLTPKIKSEFWIESEKLKLRGIIDQIEIYDKGFVPVELKTGSCPREGVWLNHKIQIGAYALLLEEEHNTQIKEGFVTYLDTNQKRHVPVNIFLKQEIMDLMEKVNNLLKNKEIPAICDNEKKCIRCGLKDVCYDKKTLKKRIKEVNKTTLG